MPPEDDYERDGFTVVRGLIDTAVLAAAEDHLAALLASQPEAAERNLAAGVVVGDAAWLALVSHGPLLDLAERLLGPGIALFSSNYVVKPARRGKAVAWHQDGGSWPLDPVSAVSLWVALDDADQWAGGLRAIPGSHRTGYRSQRIDPALLATSVFPVVTEVDDEEVSGAVAIDLRRGDVSAHHPALVHGSGPNHSPSRRAALVIRYIPTRVRITTEPWPSRIVLRP
jgi:ectoine hydroxylase-related dioxygenase (phytanoyl-CoA dioxygenase family)